MLPAVPLSADQKEVLSGRRTEARDSTVPPAIRRCRRQPAAIEVTQAHIHPELGAVEPELVYSVLLNAR